MSGLEKDKKNKIQSGVLTNTYGRKNKALAPPASRLGVSTTSSEQEHRSGAWFDCPQWLSLHETGCNCEVDARRQTEAGARAAWRQARSEGGGLGDGTRWSVVHNRLFVPRRYLWVFEPEPQSPCVWNQVLLRFNGAETGIFISSIKGTDWDNQIRVANGNRLFFFPSDGFNPFLHMF